MKRILMLVPVVFLLACGGDDDKKENNGGTGGSASVAGMSGGGAGGGGTGGSVPKCTTTTANDKGVGKPCTKGADCAGNGMATSCSADVGAPAPNYCSFINCAKDADCGTEALCCTVPGIGIKTCAPKACGCP